MYSLCPKSRLEGSIIYVYLLNYSINSIVLCTGNCISNLISRLDSLYVKLYNKGVILVLFKYIFIILILIECCNQNYPLSCDSKS